MSKFVELKSTTGTRRFVNVNNIDEIIDRGHCCRVYFNENDFFETDKTFDEVVAIIKAEIKQAKSEAIKEFAERFIDEECAYCSSESDEMIFFKKRFDNFLAKMVGEQNV